MGSYVPQAHFVVGVDVANKSMAVCLLRCELYEAPILDVCTAALEEPERLRQLVAGPEIQLLRVLNLLGGRKVKETSLVERTALLLEPLRALTEELSGKLPLGAPLHVLVEYQMSANDKTRLLAAQLVYHFMATLPQAHVHLVGPSLKQGVRFGGRSFRDFIATHRNNYCANKAYSRTLFEAWCKRHHPAALTAIPRRNLDDVADAFLMAVAWTQRYAVAHRLHFLLP